MDFSKFGSLNKWKYKAAFLIIIVLQFFIIVLITASLKPFTRYRKFAVSKISTTVQPSWNELPDKFQHLSLNPVYSQFPIFEPKTRKNTKLLIIVSSAPKRSDRRSAIRETWWKQCKSNKKVKVECLFITDTPNLSTKTGRKVSKEHQRHKDIAFQSLKGGVEFGKRFLYHMIWAMKNYNFDYFIRIDDDYFFCLERFLHELPMPMRKMYHWGYVHCLQNIVRPEESMILLSRDLVETFLDQDPYQIKGHPWADQMIATWVQELNLPNLYNHDPRLYHDPPLKDLGNYTRMFKQVCTNFIGVHGSYPKDMRHLWTLRKGNEIFNGKLDSYSYKCAVSQVFNWTFFDDLWSYEPKRWIENPIWNTSKQSGNRKEYGGRQVGRPRVNIYPLRYEEFESTATMSKRRHKRVS